jgi:hypothetical protein
MPQAVLTLKAGDISLKCDPDWDWCQKQQACTKVKNLDAIAKSTEGGLARVSKLDPAEYAKRRSRGDYYAKKYISPENVGDAEYTSECMKKEPFSERQMSGDHVHDISYGGDPKGPLALMESSVNQSMGSKVGLTQPDVTHATGFSMDCC